MINVKTIEDGIQVIEVSFSDGSSFELLNIGATLRKWSTKDKTNIVGTYQHWQEYTKPTIYMGTSVGLSAGRIRNGQFHLAGKAYRIDPESHFLHGGVEGIAFRIFSISKLERCQDGVCVEFTLPYSHSVLPGKQTLTVTYRLQPNDVHITFGCTTTEPTLFNPTHHSYFNLTGHFSQPIADHELQMNADRVVLVGEDMIGAEIKAVQGTLFDFRKQKPLLPATMDPLVKDSVTLGIDHYFMFESDKEKSVCLSSPTTGRSLHVQTSYPGVTIYTTNVPMNTRLEDGSCLVQHGAVCIEPQRQSNAINDDRFESIVLHPGQLFQQFIHYRLEE